MVAPLLPGSEGDVSPRADAENYAPASLTFPSCSVLDENVVPRLVATGIVVEYGISFSVDVICAAIPSPFPSS